MITVLATIDPPAASLPAAPIPDVVAAFLRAVKPATAKARAQDLADFARFVGHDPRTAAEGLIAVGQGRANQVAHAYRIHLEERGLLPATIARRLSSLRAVVALARTWGRCEWTLEVDAPKGETYRDTRGPCDEGWDAIRRLAAAEASTGRSRAIRDRAIVLVSHDLGLRVGELAGLDLEHVETDRRGLPSGLLILGKGRSSRERLSLPSAAAEALLAWIKARGSHPGPLFHRLDGQGRDTGRLTTRSIERLILAMGKRAALDRRLRPHGLRHHAITRALDLTGGDVRKVQRFSRHRRVETLMRYDDNRRDEAGEIARLVGE